MFVLIIFALGIVCTILLALGYFFLRVQITFSYRLQLFDTHRARITAKFLGIPVFSKSMQLPKLWERDESNRIPFSPGSLDINELEDLLQHVNVKVFTWETGIGTGEAHHTGMIAGAVWAGKEMMVRLLETTCTFLVSPVLSVRPNYQGEGLYTKLDGVITIALRSLWKRRTQLKKMRNK
jgi:hypothetical protein